jgi:hypothetical protein
MAFPPTPLQTRSEQIRKLSKKNVYIYIMTIAVPARKYGYQRDAKLWVPVCTPMPYCPLITPTKADPRHEAQLNLLLGILESEQSGCQFAPHLLLREDLVYIRQHAKTYEWPDLPADDLLCGNCYAVYSHKLGDLMPNGCDTCGEPYFRFIEPDEPELYAPCIKEQCDLRTFYPA